MRNMFLVLLVSLVLPTWAQALDKAQTERLLKESCSRQAKLRGTSCAVISPVDSGHPEGDVPMLPKLATASEDRLEWFDCYDWFGDYYIAGWSSRNLDIVLASDVNNVEDTTLRVNAFQLGPRFRMHFDYHFIDGTTDWGPSLRVFQSKDREWAIDAEPSFFDGRLGFVVKTPFGVMAKWRFDNKRNFLDIRDGLARGIVTNLALAGTVAPKAPMAKIAEHAAARAIMRWIVGAGNPLSHILYEGLLKRLFRSRAFKKFFDAPNTKGLTPSMQTVVGLTPRSSCK